MQKSIAPPVLWCHAMETAGAQANKIYQYVIMSLLVYALFYPILSPYLQALLSTERVCYYNALTGKACPFCGITRAMRAFYERGTPLPFHLLVAVCCVITELLRKIALCIAYAFRNRLPKWIIRLDICLTAVAIICLATVFLMKNIQT